jgi:hypothetical protein
MLHGRKWVGKVFPLPLSPLRKINEVPFLVAFELFLLKIQVQLKQATLPSPIDRQRTVLVATLELGNFPIPGRFPTGKNNP